MAQLGNASQEKKKESRGTAQDGVQSGQDLHTDGVMCSQKTGRNIWITYAMCFSHGFDVWLQLKTERVALCLQRTAFDKKGVFWLTCKPPSHRLFAMVKATPTWMCVHIVVVGHEVGTGNRFPVTVAFSGWTDCNWDWAQEPFMLYWLWTLLCVSLVHSSSVILDQIEFADPLWKEELEICLVALWHTT